MTNTRADMIDQGLLVDYTDIAAEMGFKWPVVFTRDLEAKIEKTIPPSLQGDQTIIANQLQKEQAMGIAVYHILDTAKNLLAEVVNDPVVGNRPGFSYRQECPWKPDTSIFVRISVEPDDDAEPAFTFDVG